MPLSHESLGKSAEVPQETNNQPMGEYTVLEQTIGFTQGLSLIERLTPEERFLLYGLAGANFNYGEEL